MPATTTASKMRRVQVDKEDGGQDPGGKYDGE